MMKNTVPALAMVLALFTSPCLATQTLRHDTQGDYMYDYDQVCIFMDVSRRWMTPEDWKTLLASNDIVKTKQAQSPNAPSGHYTEYTYRRDGLSIEFNKKLDDAKAAADASNYNIDSITITGSRLDEYYHNREKLLTDAGITEWKRPGTMLEIGCDMETMQITFEGETVSRIVITSFNE